MQWHLEGEWYNQRRSRVLSKDLADTMVKHMKDQGSSPRYKYLCFVTIGEKKSSQAMMISSRCLWNADTDNYASASYDTNDLFAVAVVFAVYKE